MTLTFNLLTPTRRGTARFLLARACDSYVSCVHCVACVAYVECVALNGNPALLVICEQMQCYCSRGDT